MQRISKAPCKVCGSVKYGSRRDKDKFIRMCHGQRLSPRTRCTVSWCEDDDWKHYLDEEGQPFKSKAAYASAVQTWSLRAQMLQQVRSGGESRGL